MNSFHKKPRVSLRIAGFFFFLGLSLIGFPSWSAESETLAPLSFSQFEAIKISPSLQKMGSFLRVRNLLTGRSYQLPLSGDEPKGFSQDAKELAALVDSPSDQWIPDFAIFIPAPRELNWTSSEAIAQAPRWVSLGFRVLSSGTDRYLLVPSEKMKTTVLAPEQAALRRAQVEKQSIRKLFDIGWRANAIQRFDLAYQAFDSLLQREKFLTEKQRYQAHLGRGVTGFYQKGCLDAQVDKDLVEADKDFANRDDVSFHRGLCKIELEQFLDAKRFFQDLHQARHPTYGDRAGFFLGVIAEELEQFDVAESAYLDTIDFATDESLVQTARSRLTQLKYLRDSYNFDHDLFVASVALGYAFDNNVAAIPKDLAPSAYGLSKKSGSLRSINASFGVTPPWAPQVQHEIIYNLGVNSYAEAELAPSYDSQSHELASRFKWSLGSEQAHGINVSYNSLLLGKYGDSSEIVRSYNADYVWNRYFTAADLELGFEFSWVLPRVQAVLASQDLNAKVYKLKAKYQVRSQAPHRYGPLLSYERRQAKGTDNRSITYEAGFFWDFPFSNSATPWYLSSDAKLQWVSYPQTSDSRTDWIAAANLSLGKAWASYLDTRLMFSGLLNASDIPSLYQYQKASAKLLVSLSF